MDISSSSPSWSCCSLIRNTKDTGELSKLALLPCTLHWLGISLFLFFTSILRHNICHSVSTVWSPHTKINSNILLWNAPFSELRFMYNFFHKNITAFVANNTCAKQGEFSFLKNNTHRWSYIFSYNFISSSTALLNMLVPSITSPTSNSSSNFLNFSTAALLSCWAIISLCGAPPEDDLGIVNIQLRKLKKSMKLCWLLISQIYVCYASFNKIHFQRKSDTMLLLCAVSDDLIASKDKRFEDGSDGIRCSSEPMSGGWRTENGGLGKYFDANVIQANRVNSR